MTDDRRAAVTTPPRLALIITATLLGGLIAGVGLIGANAIEQPLTTAAREALRSADISGVDVRFEGREAYLTPAGANPGDMLKAEQLVAELDGVRWVTVAEPDEASLPTLSLVTGPDGVVTLTGSVGTAAQAAALQQAAVGAFGPATITEITVTDGVATAPWAETAPELFAALAGIDDPAFTLTSGAATLSGSAVDPSAAQAAVQSALGEIPLQATLSQAGPDADETAAINGTVILFTADSVTLDRRAEAVVARLADVLRRYPGIEVELTGHIAIAVGTEAEAVAFSEKRAQAVADALIAAGVPAADLHIVGAGSSQPVGDNATEAGAASNRRVTVLIMEGS